jgi:DNA-binding MarR family transcriptional regulator
MSRPLTPAQFYSADGYLAEESVGWMMKRLLGLIAQSVEKRLSPRGLTNAQWAPLYKIFAGDATTVAELARQTQMDAGAMTRLLDRLEAKGLLRRVRATDDRRVVQLELTPEGQQLAAEVPAVLSEVLNSFLAGFTKSEWQALKGYLSRMLANGECLRDSEP